MIHPSTIGLKGHGFFLQINDSAVIKCPINSQQGRVGVLLTHYFDNLKICIGLDSCQVDLHILQSTNGKDPRLVGHPHIWIREYSSFGCPIASQELFGRMFTSDPRSNITSLISYPATCTSSLNSLPVLFLFLRTRCECLSGRLVEMDSNSSSSTTMCCSELCNFLVRYSST